MSARAVPNTDSGPKRPAGRGARKVYAASRDLLPFSGALAFWVSLPPALCSLLPAGSEGGQLKVTFYYHYYHQQYLYH